MKIELVAALPPLARWLYWINERHAIYLKKKAGLPRPWTDDEILQSYFFTNPFRENDKVTAWFRENIREPLRNDPRVLFATVAFRWFNLPDTGEILAELPMFPECSGNLLLNWNRDEAVARLTEKWQDGANAVFTGAYMIKAGSGPRGSKIASVCDAISAVWHKRDMLVNICLEDCRLEALARELRRFPYLGGFMAYEVVTDLRYTYLLENAIDKMTWCNIGPGARRGFNRLINKPLYSTIPPKVWRAGTGRLLQAFTELAETMEDAPKPEMRDVEHSLCEGDKYNRALFGDGGRMKRIYNGRADAGLGSLPDLGRSRTSSRQLVVDRRD